MEQGVDERAVAVARASVYDHAGGFIDDDDVRVFIEDRERQVFGLGFERRQASGRDTNRIACAYCIRCTRTGAVYLDTFGFDPGLEARTAEFGEALVQEAIETLAVIAGLGRQFHVI